MITENQVSASPVSNEIAGAGVTRRDTRQFCHPPIPNRQQSQDPFRDTFLRSLRTIQPTTTDNMSLPETFVRARRRSSPTAVLGRSPTAVLGRGMSKCIIAPSEDKSPDNRSSDISLSSETRLNQPLSPENLPHCKYGANRVASKGFRRSDSASCLQSTFTRPRVNSPPGTLNRSLSLGRSEISPKHENNNSKRRTSPIELVDRPKPNLILDKKVRHSVDNTSERRTSEPNLSKNAAL